MEFAFGRDWLHGDFTLRQSERLSFPRWSQGIRENFGNESFLLHALGRSVELLEPRSHHYGLTNLDTRRSLCERKECWPLVVRWNRVDIPRRRFRLIALSALASEQAASRKNLESALGQSRPIRNKMKVEPGYPDAEALHQGARELFGTEPP